MPSRASNPARVATKLGMPEPGVKDRIDHPDQRTGAQGSTIARASGMPVLIHNTPMIAEASPLIDPTDRSISPSINTQTMPREITPTVAQSNSRLTRLLGARNTGLSAVNTSEMTTSPTTTGSMPRSPERTRSRKARKAPAKLSSLRSRLSARSSAQAFGSWDRYWSWPALMRGPFRMRFLPARHRVFGSAGNGSDQFLDGSYRR